MDMPEPDAGTSPVPADSQALIAELASIHEQIERATTAYQPNLLTRAADACAQAGEQARALVYYGQAIDGYLATGRNHAASAVCRKILQLSPTAVRARCTLAWLALARGDGRHAAIEMRSYVEAARAAGQVQLATKQLVLLARAASSPEVREAIGVELLSLGRSDESAAMVRSLFAAGDSSAVAVEHDPSDIWAQAHRAVTLTPYDLAQSGPASKGSTATPPAPGPSTPLTLADELRADPTTPPALLEVLKRLDARPT
jgi:hypothetical protein